MNEGGQIIRTVFGTSHKEAETISMRATKGNLEFTSPNEVRFHGKDGGKKFGDFEKKKEDKPLKVTKVEGPFDKNGKKATIIKKGEFYTFKSTPSRKPSNAEVKLMKWAIKYDNGKIKELVGFSAYNKLIAGKIIVTFKTSEDFEKAKVYAYFIKASEKVSVAIMLKNLKFPILILQGSRRKGKNRSNSGTALDMLYDDYLDNAQGFEKLRKELYNETYNVEKQDSFYNVTSREEYAKNHSNNKVKKIEAFCKKTDEDLFKIFRNDITSYSSGKIETVAVAMVDKMKENKGGEFSNIDLTNAVIKHENSINFINSIKKVLKEYLKDKKGEIDELKIDDDSKGLLYDKLVRDKVDNPKFSDWFSGLGITINDVWAYQVYITKFEVNGNNYEMKLNYVYYDHFGLDYPDIQKFDKDIFYSWFVLQHFKGYKPFVTKIDIVGELKGTF